VLLAFKGITMTDGNIFTLKVKETSDANTTALRRLDAAAAEERRQASIARQLATYRRMNEIQYHIAQYCFFNLIRYSEDVDACTIDIEFRADRELSLLDIMRRFSRANLRVVKYDMYGDSRYNVTLAFPDESSA